MKTLIKSENFIAELRGWTWRGILCAVPSAVWAVMAGFTHPGEIAAMLLVVGCYIGAFTFGTTWLTINATVARARFARALKTAATIKAVSLVGTVAWWTLSVGFLPKVLGWLFILAWPDVCLGAGSLQLVSGLAGQNDGVDMARVDSFFLTGLTTLLQGAILSVLLALIALAVLGGQRVWCWAKHRQLFPASV